jgi:6-phosphogluconolactonase
MLVVGTYTEKISETFTGKGKGVYFLSWDSKTGNAEIKNHVPVINATYMVFSDKHACLYVVEELEEYRKPRFQVYKFNSKGNLKYNLIHEEVLNGSSACHIDISGNQDEISIACYTTGNTEVFKIWPNGVTSHIQSIAHTGKGLNNIRQEAAHPHMVTYHSDKLFIVDLGIDKIKVYRKNSIAYEELRALEISIKPGSGSRHMVITKDGVMVVVLSELTGEIFVFEKHINGYKVVQELNIMADDFKGIPSSAAIRMSSDEQTIYVSERATSIISVIKYRNNSWQITQQIDSGGTTPRDINIDPSGKWLVAANQDSHKLSCFKINRKSGELRWKHYIEIPSPACLFWH